VSFPNYEASAAKDKIAELVRLKDSTLRGGTQYTDAAQASRLFAALLRAYRGSLNDKRWKSDPLLARTVVEERRFGLALAAIFDLIVNIEYYRGRVTTSNWIYCRRNDCPERPRLGFYSALKQCPRCCLDRGLEPRMAKAQHKPSSHHIGEITTTVCSLLLKVLAGAHGRPLEIAAITKQSHDVDAVGYRDDLLVLFEMKASPMVTFPLACVFPKPLLKDETTDEGKTGGRVEYEQHSLVDVPVDGTRDFFLYVPHRKLSIPMGNGSSTSWPYSEAIKYFRKPGHFLDFLSAWLDLYYAYAVPKKTRDKREMALSYLVNGWGDEIDSNKTKPGLGRTDDIKKGTYQLLKFGAHYRDPAAPFSVRTALVANLDPLFMREEFLDKLETIRWGQAADFNEEGAHYTIPAGRLHFLYEAIVALNRQTLNDPLLAEIFALDAADAALANGRLDSLLAELEA
jgi:hypothetical protein